MHKSKGKKWYKSKSLEKRMRMSYHQVSHSSFFLYCYSEGYIKLTYSLYIYSITNSEKSCYVKYVCLFKDDVFNRFLYIWINNCAFVFLVFMFCISINVEMKKKILTLTSLECVFVNRNLCILAEPLYVGGYMGERIEADVSASRPVS